MENNETAVENLENLTNEQLEARVAELDTNESSDSIDYRAKYEAEQKRASMLQRLVNKKDKPINQTNDFSKDIAEIKFARKIDTFAEENGLTRVQAERVLKLEPNANAETLKDPFFAEGIKAIARKERVENATPGTTVTTSINGKSFKEMTKDERRANFAKITGGAR